MIGPVRRISRLLTPALAVVVAGTACTSSEGADATGGDGTPSGLSSQVAGEVASSDLVTGDPQRFLVGLFAPDGRVVSFGDVGLAFSYVGTAEEPAEPEPAGEATASYLPTPGTGEGVGSGPTLTSPSQARGVYQAEDVRFDRAGFWQVEVTGEVAGLGTLATASSFQVFDEPQMPFPGDEALPTKNLTMDSKDAPLGAIDSRADVDGEVPDPELHEWTIREALDLRVPALVVFATPVYCTSQFCGPVTDQISGLQRQYSDRAAFIHVEIWRDKAGNVVNRAAADWLLRNDNLTEPWTYLIGADGRILDRWGVLFDEGEVAGALRELPKLPRDTVGSG
jgi:hypothetical protein